MKDIGIYIHIPFCKQKCYYCDFLSFSNCEKKIEKYIQTLLKEIEYNKIEDVQISTIYIGGGTPSIIDEKYIQEILKKIRENYEISKLAEITIEVNPGTVNENKIKSYIKTGINRLSIGLQSTNDRTLKQIGRIHNYEEFIRTYKISRELGIKNINVDLMLALPNQSINELQESIEKVILLNPEHISVYSLILEEGTKLESLVSQNKIYLPEEDIERKMYWLVKRKLEKGGYKHYEISNFAKQGYESKHNMNCWKQMEYLGFGLGAHSYYEGKRFSNVSNLEEYGKNNFEKIVHEIQNEKEKQKEYMILGLRKIDGIKISEFKNIFVQNPLYVFRNEINKLVENKFLKVDDDYIKLTNKGIDFANIVWREFL